MKSPRLPGGPLALCLSAVLAFSPAAMVQSRTPARPSSASSDSVVVWHREAGQYRLAAELPSVSYVRTLLDQALQFRTADMSSARTVREALTERFGTRMTETAAAPRYVWVLIEGQWVLVCLSVTEFELDFGRRGHVVVQTTDEMPVH